MGQQNATPNTMAVLIRGIPSQIEASDLANCWSCTAPSANLENQKPRHCSLSFKHLFDEDGASNTRLSEIS
jgi:hypothetical protein